MLTASEAEKALIEKASSDSEFRTRLLDNPRNTIEEEFGVTLPEGFSIKVHEQSSTETHLVLPPDPRLSIDDLNLVSGGGGAACAGTSCLYA